MEGMGLNTAYQPYGGKERRCRLNTLSKTRTTFLRFCEVLVLTPAMLVIIALFSIPTILYALPKPAAEATDFNSFNTSSCLEVKPYTGEVCRGTLTSLQVCLSGDMPPTPVLNIPSLIDQEAGEKDAMELVNGLSLLSPSPQCREAVIPFLCLFIFPLCDSSNQVHTILREDCLELRDDICAEVWSQAVGFLGPGVLPVCEDLPDNEDQCVGNHSIPRQPTQQMNTNSGSGEQNSSLSCVDGFFFDYNMTNTCVPTCGEFNPVPVSIQVMEYISISVSFIFSLLIFFQALAVQRESLLRFPSILLVYTTVTIFVVTVVIIVGLLDNTRLFCGAKSLLVAAAEGNETPFCILSGLVFSYALSQFCIWNILYFIFLFWGVVYPFRYRTFKISGRIHYAHIISVLLAVVVPLPGALLHLRRGLIAIRFPALVCFGRDVAYIFYTNILPLSIVLAVSTCMLVLIFWTIFKEFVLKKLILGKKVINVTKGEVKIIFLVIYSTILGVMGLVIHSRVDLLRNDTDFEEYLLCGTSGRLDCVLPEEANEISIISVSVTALLGFYPALGYLLNVDHGACKRKLQGVKSHQGTERLQPKTSHPV